MDNDVSVLRRLAAQYLLVANDPVIPERMRLHRAVNDLRPIRPVVVISEIPWHELNADGSLTLRCADPDLRQAEEYFRRVLFQWKYFPADMIVPPYYGVRKIIKSTGIGIEVHETKLGSGDGVSSHAYINQIEDASSLNMLHNEKITYLKEETEKKFRKISDAVGDILPVKITGLETGYEIGCKNWDIIAELMGAENLYFALADDPDLMHLLAAKLTDIFLDSVRQYEELGLFEPNQLMLHGTTALNSTLQKGLDPLNVTAKHMWGRGLAQIFASVSKAMRDEFDITYMQKAMAPFGLVYYGCCEPLHNMVDILEKIPNLRKITMTPWANVDEGAQAIGKKYVMASKPNPAFVLDTSLNRDTIEKELGRIVSAAARNGCACDIALKDISSVNGRLENLVEWEKIAMRAVNS